MLRILTILVLSVGTLLGACSSGTTPPTSIDVIGAIESKCSFIPTASSIEQFIVTALGHPELIGGVISVNAIATAVCNALPPPVAAATGNANQGKVSFKVGGANGVVIEGYRK